MISITRRVILKSLGPTYQAVFSEAAVVVAVAAAVRSQRTFLPVTKVVKEAVAVLIPRTRHSNSSNLAIQTFSMKLAPPILEDAPSQAVTSILRLESCMPNPQVDLAM